MMATCKDCAHYEVCNWDKDKYDKSIITSFPNCNEKNCGLFQNKSDFVNVVRCKNCKYFGEYTEQHKVTVERADGDCFIYALYSEDRQFWSVQYDDYCSYGKRKDNE